MAGNQYVSSVKYAAVPVWTAAATLAVGAFRRQTAPAAGNERVFRVSAITTGVTGGTEPAWNVNAGVTTTDSGVTWTEVTGNPTYNWSAPHRCIQNAVQSGWGSTNNCFIYVDSVHNYSIALDINWSGANLTSGASRKILSVNAAGSVPPGAADLLPGAVETCTGNSSLTLRPLSGVYIDGVSCVIGSGGNNTAKLAMDVSYNAFCRWRNASITIATTENSFSSGITFGQAVVNAPGEVEFYNIVWKFGAINQGLNVIGGRFSILGGSVDGAGSAPSNFFMMAPQGGLSFVGIVEGMDLSAVSNTLVGYMQNIAGYIQFTDCKLNAAVTPATWTAGGGVPGGGSGWVDIVNSNAGAVNYDRQRWMPGGQSTVETTNIRSGGATNGTTAFSWKIVTNNTPNNLDPYVTPFQTPPIDIWNTTLAPITVTLNILSSTTLKNNEIGFDLYYPGSAASPKASIASTIPNVLSSGANLTSGSSGWNTSGVGTPVQQQIALTVTPAMVGMLRLQPKVLKASQTVWIDPAPVVT